MSALTHLDALATQVFATQAFANQVTEFAGDNGDELSLVLLIVACVAMAGSGIGLIILCARALLRRRNPPTLPWVSQALASATIQTRNYPEAPSKVTTTPELDTAPLSDPAPITIPRPKPVAATPAPPPAVDLPPPSGMGPSSTDPTLEMDLRAFASFSSTENEATPIEPVPPSEPTEVSMREPILLLAKKRGAVQAFEIPPPPRLPAEMTVSDEVPETVTEPIRVHRSGTVPRADPAAFARTLSSASDGARRA